MPQQKKYENPTVDEVRRVRALIEKECGHDVHKYLELLKQQERKSTMRKARPRKSKSA